MWEICSKINDRDTKMKSLLRPSGVFAVNFEQISQIIIIT